MSRFVFNYLMPLIVALAVAPVFIALLTPRTPLVKQTDFETALLVFGPLVGVLCSALFALGTRKVLQELLSLPSGRQTIHHR